MPKSIPEACRGDLPLSVFPGKAHRNLSKSMHMSPEKYDKIHVKNVAESTPEAFRGALSLSLSLSLFEYGFFRRELCRNPLESMHIFP